MLMILYGLELMILILMLQISSEQKLKLEKKMQFCFLGLDVTPAKTRLVLCGQKIMTSCN